jgi:ubiquinone/menaquinone biosynthesis C-methylase UbiE
VETAQLVRELQNIEKVTDAEWLASLDERKKRELEFHDAHRDRSAQEELPQDTYEKLYGNRKYYRATALSTDHFDRWLAENAPGKVVLDYCCGDGARAIVAAKAGASLAIGIDISRTSVENAARDAAAAGVADNTYFVQADAENTRLPDASVDVVIASGVLHHLDLSHVFPELRRILTPGGKVFAFEALDYNPAIKLYRHLTPAMRTEWEKAHILSLADVKFARRFFDLGDVRFFHITSILGTFLPKALPMLNAIDRRLTRVPGLRLMSWMFTFELIKRAS